MAKAAEVLRPLQFGVGVRGGCEGVVHATRANLADESLPPDQKWCLQVDLVNGFNLSSRSHMFEEVRRLMPELSPWVESCYGVSSVLNFGSGSIPSTAGVHQGDPLGPFLFALTQQPVIKLLQEVESLVENCWFLDDGTLIGTKEALIQAWDILVKEGEPRGLFLSQEKSLVFCPEHDPNDQDPLSRGVKRAEGKGFKLLGAPLGAKEFEEEVLSQGWWPFSISWIASQC